MRRITASTAAILFICAMAPPAQELDARLTLQSSNQNVTCVSMVEYSFREYDNAHYQLDVPPNGTFVSAGAFVRGDKNWGPCNFNVINCVVPGFVGDGHAQVTALEGPRETIDHAQRYGINITNGYQRVAFSGRFQLTYNMPGPACVALNTFRVTARKRFHTNLLVPTGGQIVGERTYAREQDNGNSPPLPFSMCDDLFAGKLNLCLPPDGPVGRIGFTLITKTDDADSAIGTVNWCGNDVDSDRECRVEIDYIPTKSGESNKKWLDKLQRKRASDKKSFSSTKY